MALGGETKKTSVMRKSILEMPIWMLPYIPVLMEQWGDIRPESKCVDPKCMVDYAENFLMSGMSHSFYVNIDVKMQFLTILKEKGLLIDLNKSM